LYLRFDPTKQKVLNRRIDDDVVLDVGAKGRIIGIEISDASRHVDLPGVLPISERKANKRERVFMGA